MKRIEKTVFVSYRHSSFSWALAVFQNLTQHGYDVFLDYEGLASGDFERNILENITARAHFLVLLTPSALSSPTLTALLKTGALRAAKKATWRARCRIITRQSGSSRTMP